MCCSTSSPPAHGPFNVCGCTTIHPSNCGCGCMGKEQSILRLKSYQDHLKAELKSVERQIDALKKSDN